MSRGIRLAAILMVAGLLLAGCFQPTGVGDLPPTSAGQAATSATASPSVVAPEPTPTPTTPPIALTATGLAAATAGVAPPAATETPATQPSPEPGESPEATPTAAAPGTATGTPTEAPTVLLPSKDATPVSSAALRTPSPIVVIVTATPPGGASEASPATLPAIALASPTPSTAAQPPTPTAAESPSETPAQVVSELTTAASTATLVATATVTPTPTATLPSPGEPPRQANGCPIPIDAMTLPPNRPSHDLRGIPEHIDYFLFSGGTIPRLEEGLRNWGVLIGGPAVAAGYFDANDQPDVALAVQLLGANQAQFNVWVFNCLGRVLYQAFPAAPSPDQQPTGVSFIEADGRAPGEVLYTLRSCDAGGCRISWHAIQWVGPNPGDVIDLLRNVPPMGDRVTKVDFLDIDGDGALELRYVEPALAVPGAPPERDAIHTWRLAGQSYVEGPLQYSEPVYRHQQVRAADEALAAANLELALHGYERAMSNPNLLTWPDAGDSPSPGFNVVNAFARYRLVQVQLLMGQTESAERAYIELIFLFPPGVTGGEIAAFAKAFWESYRAIPAGPESRGERLHTACLNAVQSAAYADALHLAQQYGVIGPASALCPF